MPAKHTSYDALILSRVVKPNRKLPSTDMARALLTIDFDPDDRERIHELIKAQDGTLLPAEEEEIASYRRIGYLLDLLRSKARKSLSPISKK